MISIHWFRRDLRFEDNTALNSALKSNLKVLPIFIFDEDIIKDLESNDSRISFIYKTLFDLNNKLNSVGSALKIYRGRPLDIWNKVISEYNVKEVFWNRDYEPYADKRDSLIESFLKEKSIKVNTHKDQVIFEKSEILNNSGNPYTVFTPYKNKWIYNYQKISSGYTTKVDFGSFLNYNFKFPVIEEIGFTKSNIEVKNYNLECLPNYSELRDFPGENQISYLSPHLRFGTVSIRKILSQLTDKDEKFLSELVWREFFMQILWHFPYSETENYRSEFNGVKWINSDEHFELWKHGLTGYPMVDAGMRELNSTGYMHNRVRMITAGFLCKHLLTHWKKGERYFAKKLLDFELSSNVGNWQWSAGTGCDAAPYFRVFNPTEQLKKFDKDQRYIKKWIPEYGTDKYPTPIVEHKSARDRAIIAYKEAKQV